MKEIQRDYLTFFEIGPNFQYGHLGRELRPQRQLGKAKTGGGGNLKWVVLGG